MIITQNTKLDAINEMLASIGEAPVDTLEEVENVDVMNCIRILDSVLQEIQEEQWSFNYFPQYTLMPDEQTGYIYWNPNFLRLKGTDGKIYQERGGVLFSLTDNTSTFTAPITVSLVLLIPFEECPAALRKYVTARASRLFSSRYLGDGQVTQQLYEQEQTSRARFFSYEIDMTRPSMANNSEINQLMNRG